MAIVMEIDHGPNKGKSYIDDDCCVNPKDVERILQNCVEISMRDYIAQAMRMVEERHQTKSEQG